MASRPILTPFQVVTNASMTSTVISSVTVIQNTTYIGYDISWTGTPTGTFSVEVSNTYKQNADGSVNTVGSWTPLTLSATPSATGSSGSGFIDIDGVAAYAIRLKYTAASGTGTLNATVSGKVA